MRRGGRGNCWRGALVPYRSERIGNSHARPNKDDQGWVKYEDIVAPTETRKASGRSPHLERGEWNNWNQLLCRTQQASEQQSKFTTGRPSTISVHTYTTQQGTAAEGHPSNHRKQHGHETNLSLFPCGKSRTHGHTKECPSLCASICPPPHERWFMQTVVKCSGWFAKTRVAASASQARSFRSL